MSELLAECQRLVKALAQATARSAALEQVETNAARAHAADKANWVTRLAQAEAAVSHACQRSLDLEQERRRLADELEAAAKRERAARQELTRSLEAARRAEGARTGTAAEVERLRAAFANAQSAVAAAQNDARRAQAEAERLEAAADDTRAEAEQIRAELETLRRTERETRSQLETAIARTTGELRE